MAKSSVMRLGFGERLDELLAAGSTLDEITDEINAALDRAGQEARVSRSAVGRAAKARAGLLAAKRRQDIVLDALRDAAPASVAMEGRLELIRTLLFDSASEALSDGEPLSPAQIKDVSAALLNVEKAGQLSDTRIEKAEARARNKAAQVGERAARQQGLSAQGASAIRQAIEGTAPLAGTP